MRMSSVTGVVTVVAFWTLVMFVDYGLTDSLPTEGELSSFLIVC